MTVPPEVSNRVRHDMQQVLDPWRQWHVEPFAADDPLSNVNMAAYCREAYDVAYLEESIALFIVNFGGYLDEHGTSGSQNQIDREDRSNADA